MTNDPSKAEKVVYILGAGFSAPAGGPSQAAILAEILRRDPADGVFRPAKRNLKDFLRRNLHVKENDLAKVALEDLYTPIDRCIADGTSLRSLVMPTFLKDLDNFQIKLVWQNAGIELMEARRLIFIGYSLPQADFEFRQLLTRMVHREAKVDVWLFEGKTPEDKRRFEAERNRYRQFFSGHKVKVQPGGVLEFVKFLPSAASVIDAWRKRLSRARARKGTA
jgi:hypothetical protein